MLLLLLLLLLLPGRALAVHLMGSGWRPVYLTQRD